MVLRIDIVFLYDINGFSHINLIRHQRLFTEILYFCMTSLVFPRDIVFLKDINGFPIDIVFYMTSMVLPIDIVFLKDINGFSHRYRIFI